MKLSLLGFDFRINRTLSEDRRVTLEDLARVNDETLLYLRTLDSEILASRIEAISCSPDVGAKDIKRTLEQNGIVIVPNFIPEESLAEAAGDLEHIKQKAFDFLDRGDPVHEDDEVLLQRSGASEAKLNGYEQLSSYSKAVANVRQGQDKGMIDIFNVDSWREKIGKSIRPYFEQPMLKSILGLEDGSPSPKNLNLYLNRGVTRTRGFHVDSYQKQLKGFVYLEDCLELDDGPYTYVTGSHRSSGFSRINRQMAAELPNSTETPLVPISNIVPVLGRKGTLVISDQGGNHRGLPQSPERKRMVAVMNFR